MYNMIMWLKIYINCCFDKRPMQRLQRLETSGASDPRLSRCAQYSGQFYASGCDKMAWCLCVILKKTSSPANTFVNPPTHTLYGLSNSAPPFP